MSARTNLTTLSGMLSADLPGCDIGFYLWRNWDDPEATLISVCSDAELDAASEFLFGVVWREPKPMRVTIGFSAEATRLDKFEEMPIFARWMSEDAKASRDLFVRANSRSPAK